MTKKTIVYTDPPYEVLEARLREQPYSRKIYIAGPMTGLPNMNVEAFDRAERKLQNAGWYTCSPAQGDRAQGIDHSSERLTDEEYMDAALRDLRMLDECDAVYFLDGYEASPGAKWEWAYAKKNGLRLFYETPTPDLIPAEYRRGDDLVK